MSAFVVAIDGPAASGKSTTARRVAERLGFVYLDTGAMYRAITWKALSHGVDIDDDDALERLVAATDLAWDERRIHVDGVDVTDEIRSPEVSRRVSVVSRASGVRRALVALQRRVAERGPCVVEGRDIGTVVFPDAALKIFLVASLGERAKRRARELEKRGVRQTVDELEAEIRARDAIDSGRTDSPLARAADAVELDTTGLSIDAQVDAVVDLVRRRFPQRED
ncbi:MAG: (d)CMP kinase [bacterium]